MKRIFEVENKNITSLTVDGTDHAIHNLPTEGVRIGSFSKPCCKCKGTPEQALADYLAWKRQQHAQQAVLTHPDLLLKQLPSGKWQAIERKGNARGPEHDSDYEPVNDDRRAMGIQYE